MKRLAKSQVISIEELAAHDAKQGHSQKRGRCDMQRPKSREETPMKGGGGKDRPHTRYGVDSSSLSRIARKICQDE